MNMQSCFLLYVLFSIIATLLNLLIQRAVLALGDSYVFLMSAIGIGTIVGLVSKFMLDKRWIFVDHTSGLKNNSKKFFMYAVMGVFTTGVFWASEITFWLIWRTEIARELGAVIGLTVGYSLKFYLDTRFVFYDQIQESKTWK
jgi:putative flippase GtrA